MAFNFTTTDLLKDIKRKAFVPMAQTTFTDADLLAMADEELQVGVVPLLMKVREEYFVALAPYQVNGDEQGFDVPERAIGSKLRLVTIVPNPTDTIQPGETKLAQIDADESMWNNTYNNYLGIPGFFMRNNQVFLSPGPQVFSGQVLNLYYFRRPNKLIGTDQCSQITEISGAVATVNLIPSAYGSGSLYNIVSDVVKAQPGFGLLAMDETLIVNTTNNTITFPYDIAEANIQVGDYICLAQESPVPQIPVELHTLLAQRTAVKILESLGDDKNLASASKKLAEMEANILGLLSVRVEGNPRKVVQNYGTLNSSPFRRF